MSMRILSPESAMRAFALSSQPYRPKEIIDLNEQIDGETKAAELAVSITGEIDPARITKIVKMKLHLDYLYGEWVEGRLQ